MKKELVDFIGCQLFDTSMQNNLLLHSEKQLTINTDGSLVQEQMLSASIMLGNKTISMRYVFPDGRVVSFENAITDVNYIMGNDYSISRIQYKVAADTKPVCQVSSDLSFTLMCDDDNLSFMEECGVKKVVFSII